MESLFNHNIFYLHWFMSRWLHCLCKKKSLYLLYCVGFGLFGWVFWVGFFLCFLFFFFCFLS